MSSPSIQTPSWKKKKKTGVGKKHPEENPRRLGSYPNRLFKTESHQNATFIWQDRVFSSIMRNDESKMESVIENRAINISCTSESCLSFGLVIRGLSKHTEAVFIPARSQGYPTSQDIRATSEILPGTNLQPKMAKLEKR